jgi:DNA-3-methyladenine glycosylase II
LTHYTPEQELVSRDSVLAQVIEVDGARWPSHCTEDPVWGLVRIVMAQQISTRVACRIAARARGQYPDLTSSSRRAVPDVAEFRALGLPKQRAECCIEILRKSADIAHRIEQGATWEAALHGIKGLGPWTLAVFKIMVLRLPDELPSRDVGLERAVENVYGPGNRIEALAENWRPFRSVACWYLWRTLGNEQLG